jgi:hypothetical protein
MRNNQFWAWYNAVAAPRLKLREPTFRKIFEHLDSLDKPVTIVETGCVRLPENWAGDGQSTVMFDNYASTVPGSVVHTVDLDPAATAACAALVSKTVKVYTGDSVIVLRTIARDLKAKNLPVDLLYLDSLDLDVDNPVPSAMHHLKELVSIAQVGTRDTLVVVDDSPSTAQVVVIGRDKVSILSPPKIGGKGMYVAEYAKQVGAILKFSHYQVGWTGLLG